MVALTVGRAVFPGRFCVLAGASACTRRACLASLRRTGSRVREIGGVAEHDFPGFGSRSASSLLIRASPRREMGGDGEEAEAQEAPVPSPTPVVAEAEPPAAPEQTDEKPPESHPQSAHPTSRRVRNAAHETHLIPRCVN